MKITKKSLETQRNKSFGDSEVKTMEYYDFVIVK